MQLGDSKLSILEHVYQRLSQSRKIDKIVIAIPETPLNDKLAVFLDDKGISYIKGSEDNVLERFYQCAIQYKPQIVVRATSDNPFVDWRQIDNMIDSLGENDYISSENAPLGTSASVFYAEALYAAYENAQTDIEKEHVTPYIYRHPELFKVKKIPYYLNINTSNYRLTVDTEQDFELADKLYRNLYKGHPIENSEVYKFLDANPEMRAINLSVKQKTI
jgi:spore coat polysaccharide biosynthesis protein SpsF